VPLDVAEAERLLGRGQADGLDGARSGERPGALT